jgi:hypothetical protein
MRAGRMRCAIRAVRSALFKREGLEMDCGKNQRQQQQQQPARREAGMKGRFGKDRLVIGQLKPIQPE